MLDCTKNACIILAHSFLAKLVIYLLLSHPALICLLIAGLLSLLTFKRIDNCFITGTGFLEVTNLKISLYFFKAVTSSQSVHLATNQDKVNCISMPVLIIIIDSETNPFNICDCMQTKFSH